MNLLTRLKATTLLSCILLAISFNQTYYSFQLWESAQATDTSKQIEYYSSRPDIFKVAAKSHPELHWTALRDAHISFVIELFHLYPNTDLYFLARDAELLYDTARLMAQDQPALLKRIHLLNVSRKNVDDPLLREYLAQKGLSEESLAAGRNAVLVDTGFIGTIPSKIRLLYSDKASQNLLAHMIVSERAFIPSSRTFLIHINSEAHQVRPYKLKMSVAQYEGLPRFTDRSHAFQTNHQKIEAVSYVPNEATEDGAVSKQKSLQYQEDLKFYLASSTTLERIRSEKQTWRALIKIIDLKGNDRTSLVASLKSFLQNPRSSSLKLSMVLDVIDQMRQSPYGHKRFEFLLHDLQIGVHETAYVTKLELIHDHPEFKTMLMNPEAEIELLWQNQDFKTLMRIATEFDDGELINIFARKSALFPMNPKMEAFILSLLEINNVTFALNVLYQNEASLATPAWSRIIKRAATHKVSRVKQSLAYKLFRNEYAAKFKHIALKIMDGADQELLARLYSAITAGPDSLKAWVDIHKKIVEAAESEELISTVVRAGLRFSPEFAINYKAKLLSWLELGNPKILESFARHFFSNPLSFPHEDLFLTFLKVADQNALYVFSNESLRWAAAERWKELFDQAKSANAEKICRSAF